MADPLAEFITSLDFNLNAAEIELLAGWPAPLIEDYLTRKDALGVLASFLVAEVAARKATGEDFEFLLQAAIKAAGEDFEFLLQAAI